VVVHTLNKEGKTAPVLFVGTRKDLVASKTEHQNISTFLFNTFHTNMTWRQVLLFHGGEGANGKADLCFFPVDNTLSRADPVMGRLLETIEKAIDDSDYVHEERPLSWLQTLDAARRRINLICHIKKWKKLR
jgi:hypothetical protein